jgi:hypothetical protein
MSLPKKVFVATPMYGGACFVPYVTGMLDTLQTFVNNNYTLMFSAIANESLITRARNELVRQFLTTDAEYLLFIDADIKFLGKDVLKLLQADKDIICGLYPKKVVDWERVDIAAKQGLTNLKDYASSYVVNTLVKDLDKVIESPVIEIKHGGTGFMLIKRHVFDVLAPHVKDYVVSTIPTRGGTQHPKIKEFFATTIEDESDYFMSEDYYFCALWRKHGGKVYADLSIILSHMGTYEYSGNLIRGGCNPTL